MSRVTWASLGGLLNPEDVFKRPSITTRQHDGNVTERSALPGPRQSRPGQLERHPLGLIVLVREPHHGIGRDHRDEHRNERHLVGAMEIKRLDPAQVVEPDRVEPNLFTEFTERSRRGEFPWFDGAVNHFPRAGTSGRGAPSEHQDVERPARQSNRIDVDKGDPRGGQTTRRLPNVVSSRAASARARKGLVRKSSAPSWSTRTSLSSSPLAVSTMIGRFRVISRDRTCANTV